MELIGIFRVLLSHHRLIVLGLAVAALAGMIADKRGGAERSSGIAVERVLIGPPDAPAGSADPVAAEGLLMRTKVLADLMSIDRFRMRIASSAGIRPDHLVVKGPATLRPWVQMPLPLRASEAAAAAGVPYVLTVEAADLHPILTLTGEAPDAAKATDIVAAGAANLREVITQSSTGDPGLAVQSLGPARAHTIFRSPSHIVAVAAAVGVLTMWCAGIVLVAGVARERRRQARARQRAESSRGALVSLSWLLTR
jgi:hypothetical protein